MKCFYSLLKIIALSISLVCMFSCDNRPVNNSTKTFNEIKKNSVAKKNIVHKIVKIESSSSAINSSSSFEYETNIDTIKQKFYAHHRVILKKNLLKDSIKIVISSSSEVATDSIAESSSSSVSFIDSSGTVTDLRDGNTYGTVYIGLQVWMSENLNYAVDSSFCYSGVESNCKKYGRLYTWAAAVDMPDSICGYGKNCYLEEPIQGVCPIGWHIPTRNEWNTLIQAVGGANVAGTKLKSTKGWKSNNGAPNEFSALPSGFRKRDGSYANKSEGAYFWTSTTNNEYSAYVRIFFYSDNLADEYDYSKNTAYSVRCIKD